jgi:hypothetical protein
MPIAYIRRLFVILQLFFVQFGLTRVEAQIPTCINGGPIYICDASSNSIYNFDPTLPTGPTNPILNTVPSFPTMGGLAVLENINGAGPSPTFYVIDNNGFFHYYNGTNWIATGHFCGSGAAINIGGGGGAI